MTKAMRQINNDLEPIRKFMKALKGKSAIIPKGFYAGRWGKITGSTFSSGLHNFLKIIIVIQPYNLTTKNGDYLNDRIDARTYWDYEDIKKTITDKDYSQLLTTK